MNGSPKKDEYQTGYRHGQMVAQAEAKKEIEALRAEIARLKGQTTSPLESSWQMHWLKVLPEHMIALVLGTPGSGKSATGHAILELLKDQAKPYVMNYPEAKLDLLPPWIGTATDFRKIPPRSVILVDESHLYYHARQSTFKEETRRLSEEMGVARHRQHSVIFVAHEARHIDRNISGYVNTFIFKRPGPLETKFERPELRGLSQRAAEFFRDVRNHQKYAYLWTPHHEGHLQIELPAHWSEELSRAYAEGATLSERAPSMADRREKMTQAKAWHEAGASYGEIARAMGVSKSTAVRWVNS